MKNEKRLKAQQIKIDQKWGIVIVIFLISSSLGPCCVQNLTHFIQIIPPNGSHANVFAFRQINGPKIKTLCTQGKCFKASSSWQLVPTPMNYNGNVSLLLTNKENGWMVSPYKTQGLIFNRFEKHISHLRLPAQVIEQIAKNEELYQMDRLKDRDLFKINSERPWSSHWRVPIFSHVTSPFGSPRIPPSGIPYAHTGMDFHAPMKTPVAACSDGVIVDASSDPVLGNVITIDHGHGLLSRYMHLSSFCAKIGDEVKAGEIIGLSGSTGRSEAPHLHWEMRLYGKPIDPLGTMHLMERLADLE